MTILIIGFYGILVGMLLRHAYINFSKDTFYIMLAVVLGLSFLAWVKYGGLL